MYLPWFDFYKEWKSVLLELLTSIFDYKCLPSKGDEVKSIKFNYSKADLKKSEERVKYSLGWSYWEYDCDAIGRYFDDET